MKTTILFFFFISFNLVLLAQNVGIGETNPTHTLHVTSFIPGDDPIRVSGLNLSNPLTDTSFVMFNNNDGVFKYIPFDNVLSLLIDSIVANPNFVGDLRDSIDTDVNNVSLAGTILSIYENGNSISVDLNSLQDGVNDADSDPNNEIQNLSVGSGSGTSSIINISGGTGVTIQVTDNLTIAQSGNVITIGGGTPSGAVMAFNLNTCPVGWIVADGSVGTPDLRGEFIRGLDNGRGVDVGRVLVSSQGDAIRNITGDLKGITGRGNNAYDWGFSSLSNGAFVPQNTRNGDYNKYGGAYYNVPNISTYLKFDASNVVPTANENRPRNVALLYCIKQ